MIVYFNSMLANPDQKKKKKKKDKTDNWAKTSTDDLFIQKSIDR